MAALEVGSTAVFLDDLLADPLGCVFAIGGLVVPVAMVWLLNRHRDRLLGIDPGPA